MVENEVDKGKGSTVVSLAAHQMPVTVVCPMKLGDLGRRGGAPHGFLPVVSAQAVNRGSKHIHSHILCCSGLIYVCTIHFK